MKELLQKLKRSKTRTLKMSLSNKSKQNVKLEKINCFKRINGYKEISSLTFQELQNKKVLMTDIGMDGLKSKLRTSFQLWMK